MRAIRLGIPIISVHGAPRIEPARSGGEQQLGRFKSPRPNSSKQTLKISDFEIDQRLLGAYSVEKLIVEITLLLAKAQAECVCCYSYATGFGVGINFASFRRFCAVAARWNSSLAPQGPRNRSLPSPRIRLR